MPTKLKVKCSQELPLRRLKLIWGSLLSSLYMQPGWQVSITTSPAARGSAISQKDGRKLALHQWSMGKCNSFQRISLQGYYHYHPVMQFHRLSDWLLFLYCEHLLNISSYILSTELYDIHCIDSIVACTVRSKQALDVLKWPTLEECRSQSVFKLVKKCLQGQCPQYFKQYFKCNNTIHVRATRQSNLLHLPAVRTEIAKRSFYYYGCTLFNELS